MGSKNKPGDYDCYANAEPDEPMFVLLGRDRDAPALVEMWALLRQRAGENPKKIAEARHCAHWMREWRRANGMTPIAPTDDEIEQIMGDNPGET